MVSIRRDWNHTANIKRRWDVLKGKTKSFIVSLLTIVFMAALIASGTLAWLSDRERIDSEFQSGILNIDIESKTALSFSNLRPLTLAQHDGELVRAQDGAVENRNREGDDPIPSYFQPVTVINSGTLPARIQISLADAEIPDGCQVENIVANGQGGVTRDGMIACGNELKEALKIYIYEDIAGEWVRIEGVNLNEATLENGEVPVYSPETALGANKSVDYVIGAHLPETVGNEFQAKHYHGYLYIGAGQTDEGADIGGPGGSTTPAPATPTPVEPTPTPGGPAEPDQPGECPIGAQSHIIYTPEDLNNVRNHRGCNFVIANDLDLSEDANTQSWIPIGEASRTTDYLTGSISVNASNPFGGTLDGGGHTIYGLRINSSVQDGTGLFGSSAGTVKNLSISDANVSGRSTAGILVGYNGGTVENCTTSGTLYSNRIFGGGLVGYNGVGASIRRCSSSAYVGGSTIQSGYNPETNIQGGLVGFNEGDIEACHTTGDVNMNVTQRTLSDADYMTSISGGLHFDTIGGLVGENGGLVTNCYSTGSVRGYNKVGGLIGYNWGTLNHCYTISRVYSYKTYSHPSVGQIEGSSLDVNSVFFIKGRYYSCSNGTGGFSTPYTGWDNDTYRGRGKTETELKASSLYSGWDESIWQIADGSFPTLK